MSVYGITEASNCVTRYLAVLKLCVCYGSSCAYEISMNGVAARNLVSITSDVFITQPKKKYN